MNGLCKPQLCTTSRVQAWTLNAVHEQLTPDSKTPEQALPVFTQLRLRNQSFTKLRLYNLTSNSELQSAAITIAGQCVPFTSPAIDNCSARTKRPANNSCGGSKRRPSQKMGSRLLNSSTMPCGSCGMSSKVICTRTFVSTSAVVALPAAAEGQDCCCCCPRQQRDIMSRLLEHA